MIIMTSDETQSKKSKEFDKVIDDSFEKVGMKLGKKNGVKLV